MEEEQQTTKSATGGKTEKKRSTKKPVKKASKKSTTSLRAPKKKTTAAKPKAAPKKLAVKKETSITNTTNEIVKKKPAKKSSARKTSQKTSSDFKPSKVPFTMPAVIVPEPIRIKTDDIRRQHKLRPLKQKPSLQHYVISLAALAIVSLIAMFCITTYHFVTVSNIESSAVQPQLKKPTTTLERSLQTSAGHLTLIYPEYVEFNTMAKDNIGLKNIWNNEAQITIKIVESENDSVVQWLKDNTPDYRNFQIITTPDELVRHRGVLAEGDTAANDQVLMFYFKEDSYVVSITMTYREATNYTSKNTEAFYSIIENLEIQ